MPCWLKKPARFTRKLLQTLKVANLTRSKGGVTALEHASQKKLDQKKWDLKQVVDPFLLQL